MIWGGRRDWGKYRKKDRAVTDADSEIPTRKETGRQRDGEWNIEGGWIISLFVLIRE